MALKSIVNSMFIIQKCEGFSLCFLWYVDFTRDECLLCLCFDHLIAVPTG